MRTIKSALLIIFSLTLINGCGFHKVRGNGKIVSKTIDVANFGMINASNAFDIEVTFTKEERVEIVTDSNLLKFINIKVKDNTLYISSKRNLNPTKELLIKISMPELYSVNLSGANNLTATGINTNVLTLNISGAAEAKLTGEADLFKVELSGAADLDAENLYTKTTKIELSGAANAIVFVTNALYADVSGAADLTYSGSPKIVNKEISGAGSIRKK